MDQPIWQPSKERIERANMTAFARQTAAAHGERLRDYGALRAWSVEHPELFWPALWRFADVRASRPWREVLVGGDRMPGRSGSSAPSSISPRTCCGGATTSLRSSPGPKMAGGGS